MNLNRRKLLMGCALMVCLPNLTLAQTLQAIIPTTQRVGSARYSVLSMAIFDITLHTPNGKFDPNKPFKLELSYLRSLKGKDIAKRSIEEMRAQGIKDSQMLKNWQTRLNTLFPDVTKGQKLTGVRDTKGHTHFFFNDTFRGTIEDPAFSSAFFNIWLGPKSSDQKLRKSLIGANV